MAVVTDNPNRNEQVVTADGLPTESLYIWMMLISQLLEEGYSGTITTAALTGAGAQGSMTFQNGVLIAQTQAT